MKRIITLCVITGALSLIAGLLRAQNQPACQPPSIPSSQPGSQTRYQFQNATFSVTVDASSTTPVSYQWRLRGAPLFDIDNKISGATMATLTIFAISNADSGNYSVVASNSCVNGVVTSTDGYLTVTAVDPNEDADGDTVDNRTELLQGRNHLIANTVSDTDNRIINLQVFTPFK